LGGSLRAFRACPLGLALAVSRARSADVPGVNGHTRTISLGTGLSCLADHGICSSETIYIVRECPATDRLRPPYRARNGHVARLAADRLSPTLLL